MKNLKMITFVLAGAALSMSFVSCRKCQICTKDSASEIRVCEKDYSSSTAYGIVIDSYELVGYKCE